MMEISAAGGTRAPLMLDWLMWLSMPNVKAEWENPARGNDKHFSVTLAGINFLSSTRLLKQRPYCECVWGFTAWIQTASYNPFIIGLMWLYVIQLQMIYHNNKMK